MLVVAEVALDAPQPQHTLIPLALAEKVETQHQRQHLERQTAVVAVVAVVTVTIREEVAALV